MENQVDESLNRWLGPLLQSTDSIFPTGAYAHSFGLEGLVQRGVVSDLASLRSFLIRVVVPMLEQSELPMVACAYRALAAEDWDGLVRIAQTCGALKGSREQRQASARIGAQRLDLFRQLAPDPRWETLASALRAGETEPYAPLMIAAQAVVGGVPLDAALVTAYYQSVSGYVSAALKILRIGQNGAQGLLTELMAGCSAVVTRAKGVSLDEVGSFAPVLDIASAQHETADSRMFIS